MTRSSSSSSVPSNGTTSTAAKLKSSSTSSISGNNKSIDEDSRENSKYLMEKSNEERLEENYSTHKHDLHFEPLWKERWEILPSDKCSLADFHRSGKYLACFTALGVVELYDVSVGSSPLMSTLHVPLYLVQKDFVCHALSFSTDSSVIVAMYGPKVHKKNSANKTRFIITWNISKRDIISIYASPFSSSYINFVENSNHIIYLTSNESCQSFFFNLKTGDCFKVDFLNLMKSDALKLNFESLDLNDSTNIKITRFDAVPTIITKDLSESTSVGDSSSSTRNSSDSTNSMDNFKSEYCDLYTPLQAPIASYYRSYESGVNPSLHRYNINHLHNASAHECKNKVTFIESVIKGKTKTTENSNESAASVPLSSAENEMSIESNNISISNPTTSQSKSSNLEAREFFLIQMSFDLQDSCLIIRVLNIQDLQSICEVLNIRVQSIYIDSYIIQNISESSDSKYLLLSFTNGCQILIRNSDIDDKNFSSTFKVISTFHPNLLSSKNISMSCINSSILNDIYTDISSPTGTFSCVNSNRNPYNYILDSSNLYVVIFCGYCDDKRLMNRYFIWKPFEKFPENVYNGTLISNGSEDIMRCNGTDNIIQNNDVAKSAITRSESQKPALDALEVWVLPRTGAVPRNGINNCKIHPSRRQLVAIDPKSGIIWYLFFQRINSDYPGPMYPLGFKSMQSVIPYFEAEDELDKVLVKKNGATTIEDNKKTRAYGPGCNNYVNSASFNELSLATLVIDKDEDIDISLPSNVRQSILCDPFFRLPKTFSSVDKSSIVTITSLKSLSRTSLSSIVKNVAGDVPLYNSNNGTGTNPNAFLKDMKSKEIMSLFSGGGSVTISSGANAVGSIGGSNGGGNNSSNDAENTGLLQYFSVPKRVANGEFLKKVRKDASMSSIIRASRSNMSIIADRLLTIQNLSVDLIRKNADAREKKKLATMLEKEKSKKEKSQLDLQKEKEIESEVMNEIGSNNNGGTTDVRMDELASYSGNSNLDDHALIDFSGADNLQFDKPVDIEPSVNMSHSSIDKDITNVDESQNSLANAPDIVDLGKKRPIENLPDGEQESVEKLPQCEQDGPSISHKTPKYE